MTTNKLNNNEVMICFLGGILSAKNPENKDIRAYIVIETIFIICEEFGLVIKAIFAVKTPQKIIKK